MIRRCIFSETEIVRDMRQTARELRITGDLLDARRLFFNNPPEAFERLESALSMLGVSNRELIEKGDPK